MNKNRKYIAWFTDVGKLDIENNEDDRKWWIRQVLQSGRMEDIGQLDFDEIERLLPGLYLPRYIRKLWEDYFEWKRKGTISF